MRSRKLSLQEFADGYSHVVLTFRPTEQFEKVKKTSLVFASERTSGRSEEGSAENFGDRDSSDFARPFFAATAILGMLLKVYRSHLLLKMQNKLTLHSAKELLEKLLSLPVGFFEQRYAGDLVRRMESNHAVNLFLADSLAGLVLDLFTAVFYLICLLCYHPVMTAIGLAGMMANLLFVWAVSRTISGRMMKLRQDKGRLFGMICAALDMTAALKASGAEHSYSERIWECEKKVSGQEQKVGMVQTLARLVPSAFSRMAYVLLLFAGAFFVIQGEMTLGELGAFLLLFASFFAPAAKLSGVMKEIQTVKTDMEREFILYQFLQEIGKLRATGTEGRAVYEYNI